MAEAPAGRTGPQRVGPPGAGSPLGWPGEEPDAGGRQGWPGEPAGEAEAGAGEEPAPAGRVA